jgi:hypothetical protein
MVSAHFSPLLEDSLGRLRKVYFFDSLSWNSSWLARRRHSQRGALIA